MRLRMALSIAAGAALMTSAVRGSLDGGSVASPLQLAADLVAHTPNGWTPSWFSLAQAHYQPDSSAAPTRPVWTVDASGAGLIANAPPGGYSVISSTIPFVEGG